MVGFVVALKQTGNDDHVVEETEDVEIASGFPKTGEIVSWLQHIQVGYVRAAHTIVDTRYVLSKHE